MRGSTIELPVLQNDLDDGDLQPLAVIAIDDTGTDGTVALVAAILVIGVWPKIVFGTTEGAVANLIKTAFGG